MNNDLVSIIVPVYNVKLYIQKCFDSIIKQTYKNIEILFIDDGSTDGSGELCDSFKKVDKRVRVIHKENKGVASSRNIGLDNAKGEYISFVDPDDYIENNFIEELYNLIKKSDVLLSVCTVINVNGKGKKGQIWAIHKNGVYDFNDYFKIRICCSVVDKLFHKSLFRELRFPENIMCSEDACLYYELIYRAKKIATTSEPLYFYFQRKNSLTRLNNPKVYSDIFKSRYYGIKYMICIGVSNEVINSWYYAVWADFTKLTKQIKKIDKNSEYLISMRQMYKELNFLVKDKLNFFNMFLFKFPNFAYFARKVAKFILFPIIFAKRRYRKNRY